MPNDSNVTRPLTLIAPGRSGTSLVSNILGAHPDVDLVGETGIMLVNIWNGVCKMEGITMNPEQAYEHKAGAIVRDALIRLFKTESQYWLQKPINISKFSFGWRAEEDGWNSTMKWYWRMMIKTFPEGKFFTVLRDPRDVVASQMERWHQTPGVTWKIVSTQMELLAHEASMVFDAIIYEDLARDPQRGVEQLLNLLGLPWDDACLEATKIMYVPGSRKSIEQTLKHRDWTGISEPSWIQKRHINVAYERFGTTIDW